jgi:hypothetical protein
MSQVSHLCYVDGNVAYFTTKDPWTDQWGDDWNDAPYQFNAETPYGPCWHNLPKHVKERGHLCKCKCCEPDWNDDGTPVFEITRVWWAGPWTTPSGQDLSVEAINHGASPWLVPMDWSQAKPIIAGVTMTEFRELVEAGGGVCRVVVEDRDA